MNIYLVAGYLVLLGIGMAIAAYSLYQRYLAGKIAVYIFTKERRLYRKLVRPGDINELLVDGKAYTYDETAIFYTPIGILGQPKPALIFHRDEPSPVKMFDQTNKSGISSEELSAMLNDAAVRDFINAQSSLQPKQLMSAIIGSAIAVIIVVMLAAYYVTTDGQGFQLAAGG